MTWKRFESHWDRICPQTYILACPVYILSCLYLSPENDQSRLMSTCLDSSHRDAFLLTTFFSFWLNWKPEINVMMNCIMGIRNAKIIYTDVRLKDCSR